MPYTTDSQIGTGYIQEHEHGQSTKPKFSYSKAQI